MGQQALHRALTLAGVALHRLAQFRETLGGLQEFGAQRVAGVGQLMSLGRTLENGIYLRAGLLGCTGVAAQKGGGQAVQARMQLSEPRVRRGQSFVRRLHGGGMGKEETSDQPRALPNISAAFDNILLAIASGLARKVPLSIESFMDSTF